MPPNNQTPGTQQPVYTPPPQMPQPNTSYIQPQQMPQPGVSYASPKTQLPLGLFALGGGALSVLVLILSFLVSNPSSQSGLGTLKTMLTITLLLAIASAATGAISYQKRNDLPAVLGLVLGVASCLTAISFLLFISKVS